MRKTFTLLCLLLGGMSLFGQLTPELLYYKFDGSGTSVPNLATTPPTGTNTATIMGGLTQGGSALCDGTLIGSGNASSTDYLNTGWAPNVGTGSWTISFRSTGISTNATLYYVFGDANTNSFRCFTNGVAGSTNWVIRGAGLTDTYINGGALSTPTMMTYVYNQTTNDIKGYLNGVLVTTVAQSAPNVTGTGPFKVMGYGSNVGAPAGSSMDDFRFYSRALTASEVMQVYAPVFTGWLGADQMLCANDSIRLGGPTTGTFTWSNGATSDSIWANTVGTLTASYTAACESGADTIAINAAPALPAPGFAGPDDTICTGDTLTLNYFTNDPIMWSTGDTTTSTWVTSPGTYTVDVHSYCGIASDTVRIDASNLVYNNFITPDSNAASACEGDNVLLFASGSYDSYQWSTGDTTSATFVNASGSYTLSVNDGCGAGTDTISLSFLTPVTAAFTSSTNGFIATFTDGSTGSGPFSYAWNFGDGNTSTQASPSHTYGANGTYTVTLTVTSSCGSETVTGTVTFAITSIANAMAMDVKVYPNPAQDQVTIAASLGASPSVRISLVSVVGQVMFAQDLNDMSGNYRQTIDLSTFASGVYFLTVEGTEGKHVTRLVVE